MARLRAASAYRRLKRAYTRRSKYRQKSFIKGVPGSRVVRYDMGDLTNASKYNNKIDLIAKEDINLRHNAIESARMSSNRYLERMLGKKAYVMKIRAVPHHVMRENPLATGAGADRYSTGMSRAFGKPIGFSARIRAGDSIFTIRVRDSGVPAAKEAMRKIRSKLPIGCYVEVNKVS